MTSYQVLAHNGSSARIGSTSFKSESELSPTAPLKSRSFHANLTLVDACGVTLSYTQTRHANLKQPPNCT